MAKYFSGERQTPLVPLSNIDRVPVSIVHAPGDTRCPIAFAEWIFTEITTPDKHFVVNNGIHYTVQFTSDPVFTDIIEETVKTGSLAGAVSNLHLTIASVGLILTALSFQTL